MTVKPHDLRSHTMIDQPVQGALIGRVVRNWTLCLVAFCGTFFCWTAFLEGGISSADWSFFSRRILPCLLASYVVLPIAIVDQLRLSCRFVGPIHEIKTAIRRTLLGDNLTAVELRKSDYWHDLADQLNELLDTKPEGSVTPSLDSSVNKKSLGLGLSPLTDAYRVSIAAKSETTQRGVQNEQSSNLGV